MIKTYHPGGLQVFSGRETDTVEFVVMETPERPGQNFSIEKDVLQAVAKAHSQQAHDEKYREEQENDRLRVGLSPHPFELDESASGFSCTRMVMRDGGGDQCGLPSKDRIHDDPREGQDFDYEIRS